MKVAPHRLKARQVDALKEGSLSDGGNLWVVARGGSKAWSFRFKSPVTGKRREMGFGPTHDISLAEARELASAARILLREGIDPIDNRSDEKAQRKRERGISFEELAGRYITEQSAGWRDERWPALWRSSLEKHAYPILRQKPVSAIDTDDVLAVLRPIWTEKTETASRVRSRIERILDYAKTQNWREGENPARWRGHLSNILPAPGKVAQAGHFAALDRKDVPRVMAALTTSEGIAAKVTRFICLTAARSGEARGAVWSEIDLENHVWTIPKERMKAAKEHRVPLCDTAMAILREVMALRDQRHGDFIFPGQKAGKPLSDVAVSKALHIAAGTKDVTVHGLRSTFRDWAAEETDYPREVAEMALAHAIGDKVEAAYRRGDLFAKRRQMMDDWERWCSGP
ncbi:tyrosine-type recombinase/integrase [Komagataeibacter sp. AV436]|uniref:Tyrosine-type recombinase/integrase n=1 Tax=Komagataeibacter melomenusus TaxID=2766578 RepID=A0ABX2ACN5_9PROT|nr:tyrosine-type recombinase/integrase [Komagataeibacter melomenusus]MBV1830526.1 tyrosine-type recombinase/integrase [Komagataeibacter melomenusus]NPC66028.1 tyrosine-type recombinase/integrase [Komagataeibacter melomenusus]